MYFPAPELPASIQKWGAGNNLNIVAKILENNEIHLDNPKLHDFEEIKPHALLPVYCSGTTLSDKHRVLMHLSPLCLTRPAGILIVENVYMNHHGNGLNMLRFHHSDTIKPLRISDTLKPHLPFRAAWLLKSPVIFYESVINTTAAKKGIPKSEARNKTDTLIANRFSQFDVLIDLANGRMYKRKSCLDIEHTLNALRYMDSAVLFNTSDVRRAILEYIAVHNIDVAINFPKSRIEYLHPQTRDYHVMSKELVIHNGSVYQPYAGVHSFMICKIRLKKNSINFLINTTLVAQKYSQNTASGINDLIPHHGIGKDAEKLEDIFIAVARTRAVDSPVYHLNQPGH